MTIDNFIDSFGDLDTFMSRLLFVILLPFALTIGLLGLILWVILYILSLVSAISIGLIEWIVMGRNSPARFTEYLSHIFDP